METITEPCAQLYAADGGYRLVLGFTLNGNESDPEFHAVLAEHQAALEQARLMVNTLTLVGFQPEAGEVVMERTESGVWRRPERAPVAVEPAHGFAMEHIREVLRPPVETEVEADPVLRAVMNGAAPKLNQGMAAALARALPERERVSLVDGMGGTARQVYLWLTDQHKGNTTTFFTVAEIAKATGITPHSVSTRLSDLESAALVERGTKQISGKHKKWTAYRALVEERAMARSG